MDLFRFDPPELETADACRIAADRWGIVGTGRRLPGERSHNTLITSPDGRRVVLKIQSATESHTTIDLHARALVHVADRTPDLPVARMLPTLDGELVPLVEHADRLHPTRMVSYLPGRTFDPDEAIPERGFREIGRLIGAIAAALADFDHPAAAGFMAWDIANGLLVEPELRRGVGPSSERVLSRAESRLRDVVAVMSELPRQVIHNDGHAGNLLRAATPSDRVTGIIDFGDVVHTVRAADVAVAAESFAAVASDPAGVIAALTAGYCERHHLDSDEIAAMPDLVLARQALTVLLVEHQIAEVPHLAERAARYLPAVVANMERWLALDPVELIERTTTLIEDGSWTTT